MNRRYKDAAAVFGELAVQKVLSNLEEARAHALKYAHEASQVLSNLAEHASDIRALVAIGQSLNEPMRQAVIFYMLGYGGQELKRQGFYESR